MAIAIIAKMGIDFGCSPQLGPPMLAAQNGEPWRRARFSSASSERVLSAVEIREQPQDHWDHGRGVPGPERQRFQRGRSFGERQPAKGAP